MPTDADPLVLRLNLGLPFPNWVVDFGIISASFPS
jgi:hypothetical protein